MVVVTSTPAPPSRSTTNRTGLNRGFPEDTADERRHDEQGDDQQWVQPRQQSHDAGLPVSDGGKDTLDSRGVARPLIAAAGAAPRTAPQRSSPARACTDT